MTDFGYLLDTAADTEFRAEFRAWLDEHLPSGWGQGDSAVPRDPRDRRAFLRDWQAEMARDRWVAIGTNLRRR